MKRALKAGGIALVVLLALLVLLPFLFNADQYRPTLQTKLSAALGRAVTLDRLRLSLLSQSIAASNLAVADDLAFSSTPFLRASSLKARVELMPLIFARKLKVTRIVIEQPQIDLVQNAAGIWNFSSIEAKSPESAPQPSSQPSSATPDFSVQAIEISGGRLTVARAAAAGGTQPPPVTLDKLNIELKDFSADSSFNFTLAAAFPGGGEIKLDGKAGPVRSGNAIATPLTANLRLAHLDLAASGLLDPALGIAGIVSSDGNLLSNGSSALVSGKLKGEQLKLVQGGQPATRPLEVDFALNHDVVKQTGTIQRGDIHFGSAVASLTGTYNMAGASTLLNLKLIGSKLDVTELGSFLPAINIILPEGASIQNGTAEVDFTAEGPADKLVAMGTVGLDDVQLTNFDLVTKLSVLDEMAGIKPGKHTEIQTFRATLRTAPDGTQVEDIELVVPSIGHISGAGTMSPAHELAFKMRAAIHRGMGAVASLGSKGGVPFTVSGTSQKPSFKADVKALAKDKFKDLENLMHGKKKKAGQDATPSDPSPQ